MAEDLNFTDIAKEAGNLLIVSGAAEAAVSAIYPGDDGPNVRIITSTTLQHANTELGQITHFALCFHVLCGKYCRENKTNIISFEDRVLKSTRNAIEEQAKEFYEAEKRLQEEKESNGKWAQYRDRRRKERREERYKRGRHGA